MTTEIINSVPSMEMAFSKDYVSAYGVSTYLTSKIKVSGNSAFDFNAEYNTITLKLNENSVAIIKQLNLSYVDILQNTLQNAASSCYFRWQLQRQICPNAVDVAIFCLSGLAPI